MSVMDDGPLDPFVGTTPGDSKLKNGQLLTAQLLELSFDQGVAAVLEMDRDDLEDIVLFVALALGPFAAPSGLASSREELL